MKNLRRITELKSFNVVGYFIAALILLTLLPSCSREITRPLTKKVVTEEIPLESIPDRLQLYSSKAIVLDCKSETVTSNIKDGVLVNKYHQDDDADYEVDHNEMGTLLPGGNINKIEVRYGPEDERLPYVPMPSNKGYAYSLDFKCDKGTAKSTVVFKGQECELVQGKHAYIVFKQKQKVIKTSDKQKAEGVDVTSNTKSKPAKKDKKAKKGEVIFE